MPRGEHSGLIVRQKSPLNLEFHFSELCDWLIPTDQFFVRSHFPTPQLDVSAWRLHVTGCVAKPISLSLEDVHGMDAVTLPAVVECAGNGRVFYEPAREGLQWQNGAVGNAAWTGVRLRDVLLQAGVAPEAVEVVLVGADRGVVDGGKKTASPGPIAFARSIPLSKAMDDCVLLAYAMNGETLSSEHGYPLRAVVGGWFGMAWVKWIAQVRVVDGPFLGYWQARDYFQWDRSFDEPILVPLTEMAVKAQIARPVSGQAVAAGRPYRVFGAAWGGEAPVCRVQVCVTQCGDSRWEDARLLPPDARYAWRWWEYTWTPPEPGRYSLACRATDTSGASQPSEQQPDRESYMANWMVPVEVKAVGGTDLSHDDFMI